VAVATNAVLLSVYLSAGAVPQPYHIMFTFPKLALVNATACKVFRDIKFGRLSPTTYVVDLETSERQTISNLSCAAPTNGSQVNASILP
jgi:hypothetical protein